MDIRRKITQGKSLTPTEQQLGRTALAMGVNCLPFLGHEKWEALFMRVDLRVKHDVEARKAAIEL
ncbi:hypothetical protein DXA64_10015, partial [Collinsella sp. OF03-4AA]